MTFRVGRRQVLMGGSALAAAGVAGLRPAFAQDARIRHFWWGNPERDKRTFEVIDLFNAEHDDIEVSGETIGWGDYWTKMATQTAGGNMADLVQMDYRYLFEYARRGALKPLDPFIGSTLDLSSFDQSAIDGGMVDGQLYALNIGSNSQVTVYNTRLVDESGEDFDPINWTYEDLERVATAIAENTGAKGSDDMTVHMVGFENWAAQHGHLPFNEAGDGVGYDADLVAAWWEYWARMRGAGAVPTAEETVAGIDQSMNDSGIVTGKTAMSYYWSNQIVGVQALMQDNVGAAMYPHLADGEFGQFIKPSMFMSLTRDSSNDEAAVTYMNNWVNGEKATAILGLERGIPASSAVRERLAPTFSEPEQVSVNYFNAIQDKVGPLPPPPPAGAGEVGEAFERVATAAILGEQSIPDAARAFVDEANSILARASS